MIRTNGWQFETEGDHGRFRLMCGDRPRFTRGMCGVYVRTSNSKVSYVIILRSISLRKHHGNTTVYIENLF